MKSASIIVAYCSGIESDAKVCERDLQYLQTLQKKL